MAWTSFAELQARHSPRYIIETDKMHAKVQLAREMENTKHYNSLELLNRTQSNNWDLARYKEEQERQREEERGRTALAVESKRGENRIAELDRELSNKIQLVGVEAQFAREMKFIEEVAKNNDFFRNALTEQMRFRIDGQKEILRAMLTERQADFSHWREIEKTKLDAEHKERLQQIDNLAKKALAYGEVVTKEAGEQAGADAVNSIVSRWNLNG
jgi:hypothetical protein